MKGSAGDGEPGGASQGPAPGTLSALLLEIAGGPDDRLGEAWGPALHPGSVVGRLELVRELGRGGFGVVWEAKDRELGRSVAFKAVRAGGKSELREERLLREAEAAARLSHPNIVTLFDVGRSEQGPYLVLELLRGRTLAERLAEGPLPLREATSVATEVAKGLAHAHASGVVHRDLKPGNIFLCQDGQVKVLDFGLAHAFGRRRQDGGTPAYMAPEQMAGAPEDERTDVFALGVMLFEMLSGKLPFPDAKALASSSPAPLLETSEAPALGELVGRMLAKEPVGRPRDGGSVQEALSSIRDALVPAGPSPAPVRVRRRLPRLAVMGLLAASLGVAIAGVLYIRKPVEAVPSPTAGGRITVAVLPFASLNQDPESVGLTGGLHDAVITQLSRLGGLQVRSRTSVMKYQGWTGGLRPIADELGVGLVLEGTVQRVGHRLVVNAQLVDARNDTHLWVTTLDRTSEDLFTLQSEIAQQVVEALRLTITPDERQALTTAPTRDKLAYAMYLQARQLRARATNFTSDSPGYVSLRVDAIGRMEQAAARDPEFALAFAELAGLHADIAWASDTADYRLHSAAARKAAERAIALRPGLPEANLARGLVLMQLEWRYAEAAEVLARAVAGLPSEGYARASLATALNAAGRWEDALTRYREAVELEPGIARYRENTSMICLALRDPTCAREAARQAALLEPANARSAVLPAVVEMRLTGDPTPVRTWLAGPGTRLPPDETIVEWRWYVRMADGDYVGALRAITEAPAELQPRFDHRRAQALRMHGRTAEARSALQAWQLTLEKRLSAPRDAWVEAKARAELACVRALLGDRGGAIAEARRAEALYSYERDPADGSEITAVAATAYFLAGDRESALERLTAIVRGRSQYPAGRIWTEWDLAPFHADPRFRALIASQGIDVSREPFAQNRPGANR